MARKGGIVMDYNHIETNLKVMAPRLHAQVAATMDYFSERVQNDARSSAPWTDRTTNARGGLFAKHTQSATGHRITLYHTMPYGMWLELANGGKYRVIMPVIQRQGVQLMGALKTVMGKM